MSDKNYPHTTTDSKGQVIHYKTSDYYQWWQDFDEYGNMTHFKSEHVSANDKLMVVEFWKKYDANGGLIHYMDNFGCENWYDGKGKLIPNPAHVKEVTMEQIAKALGIKVENLKIVK